MLKSINHYALFDSDVSFATWQIGCTENISIVSMTPVVTYESTRGRAGEDSTSRRYGLFVVYKESTEVV